MTEICQTGCATPVVKVEMSLPEIIAILPLLILFAGSVVVMLTIAWKRHHGATMILSAASLALALACMVAVADRVPQRVGSLLIVDGYATFFGCLLISAAFAVVLLSYPYLEARSDESEEYYVLLIVATLGAVVLVSSAHFASFFLGLEILGVSLYGLIGYRRGSAGVEAAMKYLVLAAISSAFLLFGMALMYAQTGSLEFSQIAGRSTEGGLTVLLATGLLVTGIGFKLAVVPFHMWTPDVYEGAPAPVSAFVASVSKGAVFALALRYFSTLDIQSSPALLAAFSVVAVASMIAGNLLALLQDNVKRMLAYSSIAHLGYLLVAFVASGEMRPVAVGYYLAAYFITIVGAFGVIGALSGPKRDLGRLEELAGLAWDKPWHAAIFTAMLLSLAGIPLTAGFIGKFYLIATGIGSSLWLPVLCLLATSAIGLFYYIRVILVMFTRREASRPEQRLGASYLSGTVLAALCAALLFVGMYPTPLIGIIRDTVATLK